MTLSIVAPYVECCSAVLRFNYNYAESYSDAFGKGKKIFCSEKPANV